MRLIYILMLLVFLTACEAPLVLDGVEASKKSNIRRTDVFMAAGDNGNKSVIVGSEGLVMMADSGADNWTRSELDGRPVLVDVTSCPNGIFAALSMEGTVSVSEDDGKTWVQNKLDTPEVPQAISCDPKNRLWVVGSYSTILSSTDNAKSWSSHSLEEDMILSTVEFLDENKGIITGEFGTVLMTENGGESWDFAEPIPKEFAPLGSIFIDSQHGWVVGLNGTVYSTADGGGSWQQEKTGVVAPLFGVSIANNHVIAVGDAGTIIQRDINAAGDSWQALDVPITSRFFFRVVLPLQNKKLIIAGGAGSLEVVDLHNVNFINVDIN
jgi:photosystem II stability/assembly factor-like uncharacterized protein